MLCLGVVVFFIPCLPNHWCDPLLHLTYCLFLPVYYLFQILHSLFWTGPFLWFSMSLFMLFSILITSTLNYLINCLPPYHLALLENSLVLSFGVCFFVFPFCLLLCICFYVLGRSTNNLVWALVTSCLWLALVNLFGVISNPQHVAPSAGSVCVHKKQGCVSRPQGQLLSPWGPGEGRLKPHRAPTDAP